MVRVAENKRRIWAQIAILSVFFGLLVHGYAQVQNAPVEASEWTVNGKLITEGNR